MAQFDHRYPSLRAMGSGSVTVNTLAAGAEVSADITIAGAVIGDFVLVAPSEDIGDSCGITVTVSADDTITINITNLHATTALTLNGGSAMTWTLMVLHKDSGKRGNL